MVDWFLHSGMLVSDTDDPNYGAVHSFYDESRGEFGSLYPEITGYSASMLSFLYRAKRNEKYLELAKASCIWLTGLFDRHGAIVHGTDDSMTGRAYSFDTAICAKGLLDCYSISKEPELLEYSKRLVDWVLQSLGDDGTMMPMMNLAKSQFIENNDFWYNQKGCLHIKAAMPVLRLYEITRDGSYREKATLICDTYRKFRQNDGSLRIHADSKSVNLHTQCYALEGLMCAYGVTGDDRYLESCKSALDWCASRIPADGGIQLWFNSRFKSKAVYHVAQIARLMVMFDRIHDSDRYEPYIGKLCGFMGSLQAAGHDRRIDGGLYEEFYRSVFGWKKRLKLNSWGTMFAIQALYWRENDVDFKTMVRDLF